MKQRKPEAVNSQTLKANETRCLPTVGLAKDERQAPTTNESLGQGRHCIENPKSSCSRDEAHILRCWLKPMISGIPKRELGASKRVL